MGWGGAGARGGGGYGGNGGGGGMFRTVTRVSRASLSNLQDHSSPSSSSSSSPKKSSKRGLSVSSKSADVCATSVVLSNSNLGFGPAWPLSSTSSFSDESDWVCIQDESERTEIETDFVSLDDCVFGSAPSPIEAQAALISLQNTLPTSRHSASDWIEPVMYPNDSEQSICCDIGRVYDAFHLLQTDPSIQRMVISLSSDKAVWNAVLNNEAVQELKEAISRKDEVSALESSSDEPNPSSSSGNVLSWIFDNMRVKFMEFLTGITDLMKEVFQPPSDDMGNFPDGFGERVRAAFMLTAIVLLIVVVTRASHA